MAAARDDTDPGAGANEGRGRSVGREAALDIDGLHVVEVELASEEDAVLPLVC